MYNFKTKNGRKITVTQGTMNHMKAHQDVDMAVVDEALKKINFVGDFFIGSVDMGRIIGKTSCVEVKPTDEVIYFYRKNRSGKTPFVKNRVPIDTKNITICLKKDWKSGRPILVTAYYGDRAPMEPWDARRKGCNAKEIEECDIFWKSHALIYDVNSIDFEKEESENEGI